MATTASGYGHWFVFTMLHDGDNITTYLNTAITATTIAYCAATMTPANVLIGNATTGPLATKKMPTNIAITMGTTSGTAPSTG